MLGVLWFGHFSSLNLFGRALNTAAANIDGVSTLWQNPR